MTRPNDLKGRYKAAFLLIGLTAPVVGVQADVTNYTYDELGRLVLVTDTRNGNRVFIYDPAGNRRQVIVGGTGQPPPSSEPRERDPRPGSRRAAVDKLPEMLNFGEDLRAPLASLEELPSPTIEVALPAVRNTKER